MPNGTLRRETPKARKSDGPAVVQDINMKIQKLLHSGYKITEILNQDPYKRTLINKIIDQYLFKM